MEKRSSWIPITLLGLVTLLATPLSAQYTFRSRSNQSIIFETAANTPDAESMRKRVEDAPFKLGIFKLSPSLGFRDARFVSNRGSLIETSAEPVQDRTDFTATFAAGMRAYVKNGEKVIWTVHGIPEYVWWQDDSERRRLNGRYGAGVFAFFNRLTLEASHRQVEEQSFFSPEVERLTSVRVGSTRLYASTELSRGVFLFASFGQTDFESSEDEARILSRLDRERQVFRAGLRFVTRGGLTLGLGHEDGSVEFANPLFDRSNDATAEIVELNWQGGRLEFAAAVAFRSLQPTAGSSFVATDETTGDLNLTWKFSRNLSATLYALQELSFSVLEVNSNLLSERQGIVWSFDNQRERRRFTIELFAETGKDEFTALATVGGVDRVDDAETYGGSVSYYISHNLQISIGGLVSKLDSSFDPEDREVSTFGINLIYNFSDVLDRIGLRLGASGGNGW